MSSVSAFNFDTSNIVIQKTVKLFTTQQISDWSKRRVLSDDKISVAHTMKFGIKDTEIIVGKEENSGNQYFVFFPKKISKFDVIKTQDCVA